MHLSMTCLTAPHADKGGDRLGIYLIVEVMTLPLGQFIGWIPTYFVHAEGKRNICLARETRIYLSEMLSSLKKETSYVSSKYSTSTLGKGKSPLVWAIISGKTPPKPHVLPAWGGVGQVIDRCIRITEKLRKLSQIKPLYVWGYKL